MRGLSRVWTSLLVVVIVAVVPAAAAAPKDVPLIKQTKSPIATIAMDGTRVAYASGGKVYVWNTLTGATTLMKGNYSSHTSELAIAGTRVAWITRYVVGNSYQTTERLFTAPVGGTARLLRSARHLHGEGIDDWRGGWVAGLVGSGKTLAVSTWWSAGTVCTGQKLSLITPTGLTLIATGPGAIISGSAEGGRIAVLRSHDAWPTLGLVPIAEPPATIGVYSSTGMLLREIVPSSAKEAALSGARLVVLTETRTVEVYNWRTGALIHTWPVAAKTPRLQAGHLAVYGQLATYSVDPRQSWTRSVHVLQLATGRDVVLATARGSARHDAAIGPRGLVYVVTYYEHNRIGQPQHGKLVLVPLAKVLAAVR